MTNRPFLNLLLFLASFLIVASILFGISACTSDHQSQPKITAKVSSPSHSPVQSPPVDPSFSVDFSAAPLSEVAQFVTTQTGIGFTFTGLESYPITWIESNLTKRQIFKSFQAAVIASDLLFESSTIQGNVFTIEKPKEPPVTVLLNYARSSRGVFLLLGSTIYPLDKFPYPVRYDSGHWYGLLPKSIADQKKSVSEDKKI